jgi:hypothetical protein
LPLVARHRVGLGGNSTNIVFVPAKLERFSRSE